MSHHPLNPQNCPVAIDANALDRDGGARDRLVDRLLPLGASRVINLVVPKGVRVEMQHPRTPAHVQGPGLAQIYTIEVGLNSEEQRRKQIITAELQGNAKPGRHKADADHLFEAAKYGGFFITHDERILTKAGRLRDVLPPSLTVVTLAGFLAIFDDWEARYPR
jgi:hypothetical protein